MQNNKGYYVPMYLGDIVIIKHLNLVFDCLKTFITRCFNYKRLRSTNEFNFYFKG